MTVTVTMTTTVTTAARTTVTITVTTTVPITVPITVAVTVAVTVRTTVTHHVLASAGGTQAFPVAVVVGGEMPNGTVDPTSQLRHLVGGRERERDR